MKAIILAILLVLSVTVSSIEIKAHFVGGAPGANVTIDGHAYFTMASKIDFKFDGLVKRVDGQSANCKGTGVIESPFMMNLDKIKFNGALDTSPAITFTGVVKISVLDVLKPKIPYKGTIKANDGHEYEVNGLIDKPWD